MKRSHDGPCVIPGACVTSGFRRTREETGPERNARYRKLVREGYQAAYLALNCKCVKGGAKIGRLDNVTLVALKRVAEKLYFDAVAAHGIIERRLQASHEDLDRRENAPR